MSSAETANVAASSTSTLVAPTTAMRTPASGAPSMLAPRETPSKRLVPRSSVISARSSRSGSIVSRAVWPGASSRAPAKTSASSAASGRPTVWYRIGIAEHREPAREVGGNARPAVAEPVDDHPAEGGGDHERQQREEADEAGLRDAPRGLEHEPGNRELRQPVARDRDRVGGEQPEERRPAPAQACLASSTCGKSRIRKRAATASSGASFRVLR